MKYKTIKCPFCGEHHAHITYEESRVYHLNCTECHNAIFHQDRSWDATVNNVGAKLSTTDKDINVPSKWMTSELALAFERAKDPLPRFLMKENGDIVPLTNCQQWISVTERLPEKSDKYLCNVKSSLFRGATYQEILGYDKGGFHDGCMYMEDVTHWMPLPEPPKGE